jgi:Na+/melibiose symporter-like transporter
MVVISALLLDEKQVHHQTVLKQPKDLHFQNDYETIPQNTMHSLNHSKLSELKSQMSLFWNFLKMDLIYKPVIFIFLYMLAPSYGDPLFYFYTNVLNFDPMTMGRLRLIYGIASVLGIWTFNKFLRNVSFKKIMWSTTILSIIFNLLTVIVVTRMNLLLGIPDFVFCMAADALTTALAEINTLPLLVLACNICPKNIEGTLYAFIMSVLNLGSLFSNQFGSYMTSYLGITSNNFTNLSTLIIIANIVLILPMPSLCLVNDNAYIIPNNKEEHDEEENQKIIQKDNPKSPITHFNDESLEENKIEHPNYKC